ncbi:MAG: hypothetical protein AABX24_05075 [Nanoarchaeota archaeon]
METEKYELKYGLKKGSFSAALVEKAIAAIYSAVSRQNEIPSLHGTLDSLKQILYGRPEMLSDLASILEIKNDENVSTAYLAVYDAVKRFYLGVGFGIEEGYSKGSGFSSVRIIASDDSKSDDPPSFPPLAPKQVLNPKINGPVKEKSLEQLCHGIIC